MLGLYQCGTLRGTGNKLKTEKADSCGFGSQRSVISQVPGVCYTWSMRANSVGKESVEAKNAYLAGFIDGDGSIMAIIERHKEKRFGFRVRIVLKITQKHKEDVSFLPKLTRCGTICKNGKTFDWKTRDQTDVARVLASVQPYSRVKRRQIDIALKILRAPIECKEDLLAIATLADTLSRCNVRSNNRRKNYATKIQTHFSSND